jgi:hypothetical protein
LNNLGIGGNSRQGGSKTNSDTFLKTSSEVFLEKISKGAGLFPDQLSKNSNLKYFNDFLEWNI